MLAATQDPLYAPATAFFFGMVSDDGEPSGTLNLMWSVVSGPGPVFFSDPTSAVTQADFSVPGFYILRLTASDGEATSFADTSIEILELPF